MAKFKFIYWLVEFLFSSDDFYFEWDESNSTKSENKHGVTLEMIESAFSDEHLLTLGEQYQPSIPEEDRYGIIAKSAGGEVLFICFTIRKGRIRPVSARVANKKERSIYEQI